MVVARSPLRAKSLIAASRISFRVRTARSCLMVRFCPEVRSMSGRSIASPAAGRGDLRQGELLRTLDLAVGAVLRRFIHPPALEGGGVAEAFALQVVERHLAD